MRSQYQQKKDSNKAGASDIREKADQKPCQGCGKTSHPGGKSLSHRHCPEKNVICNGCSIMGHFKAVCRKTIVAAAGSTSKSASIVTEEGNTQDTSTIFSYQTAQPSAHMEWTDGEFKEQSPSRPPQVAVTVSVIHEAHRKFGKHLRQLRNPHNSTRSQTPAHKPALADLRSSTD